MKILFISDTHLRYTSPKGRIDNYYEAQMEKWKFLFSLDYDIMLQAGDFFDSPNPPYKLVNDFLRISDAYNAWGRIYVVYGQHDMYMRNMDIGKTALGLLSQIPIMHILSKSHYCSGVPLLYGRSFGEEDKFETDSDYLNILVVHDMIGNKPLFLGHEITKASHYLREHPEFDIILCGDYHYPFFEQVGDRTILNTGCLMRMTRDERDMNRTPHCYIYDTEKCKFRKIKIPCKPAEEVFSLADMKDKPNTIELEQMITRLKQRHKVGTSYMENLEAYFAENETSEEIQKLILRGTEHV